MLSKRFSIWICLVACLAMLGCFINCALEGFDEHGCEDECLSCACDGAVTSTCSASPAISLLAKGLPGAAAMPVPAEFLGAAFLPSSSLQFRFSSPDRLYQLHAAYLI